MTDTSSDTATPTIEGAAADHDGDHGHVGDNLYIRIAIILGVITALEVSWPFLVDDGPILLFPLLAMMIIKFVMIASFFMHLKFDSKVLTRVFYAGLLLAVGVYVVTLMTFRLFESGVGGW